MSRPWRLLVWTIAALVAPAARACPWCRDSVEAAVYTPDALETALVLWLPLVALALVGAGLYCSDRPSLPAPP